MRILHVVPSVSPRFGGHGNVPGLVRSLGRYGVDATLLTTNDDLEERLDVPLNQPVVRDGVRHVVHPVWGIGGRYRLAPSIVTTLRSTVASYDLVHIHWLYDFTCIAAARAAIAAGVPFVEQPRGSLDPHLLRKNRFVKRVYMSTVGRPLLTRAAAIVFTAEQERDLAAYGRRGAEWIVPNGLDASRYARLPRRGTFRAAFPEIDGPFVLFLSRLSPQKGLDLLLPAFAEIARARPDLWLVVAGPDHRGHAARVRALASRLGIRNRVLFTGMLTHEPKLAALVDAELLVLPSYAENFGVVIMEALICGLPVVISDRVNIHRELTAAGAATVVPCSIDGVRTGIESVLADPTARERTAAIGPALVRREYTWDAIVPRLVELYRTAITRRRSAA